MENILAVQNEMDSDGNPTGGYVKGPGLDIQWQNGPLGRGADRKEPNGAFVEDLLSAAASRMKFYQSSKFSCRENAIALTKIQEALFWLRERTMRREFEGTEGTHSVN